MVAAVYRTPLPEVMNMPLVSILAWLRDVPAVLPLVDPNARAAPEDQVITTGEGILALAERTGMKVVRGG